MDKIRIMVVDDMQDIREYFSLVLSHEPKFEIVGQASSGKEAIAKAMKIKPDVILMDIQMESDNAGIDATEKILKELPETKVIMLSVHDDDENIIKSFMAGACDYVTKTSGFRNVIDTICDNVHGSAMESIKNKVLVNEMLRMKNERNSLIYMVTVISRLTKSEFQILKLCYKGYSYSEIAEMRFVEEETIRSFVSKILKKANSTSMKTLVDSLKRLGVDSLMEDN